MTTGNKSVAAQYLYLAQLDAQKGKCSCKACQLLRKSNDAMIDGALAPAAPGAVAGTPPDPADVAGMSVDEQ